MEMEMDTYVYPIPESIAMVYLAEDTITVFLVFVIEKKVFNYCFLIGSVTREGFTQAAQSQTSEKHMHQSLEICSCYCKCFTMALQLKLG